MLIQLQGIWREYETGGSVVHALRDVDLEIEAGEALAILGPSGSGKSTLMHILGCLDRPTRGSYLLDGQDVSNLDVDEMAKVRNRTIGFVFQRFHLMPRSTALANVALPLRFAHVERKQREARAAQLLERVGLGDRMTHLPSQLSGGQQQRVAIARALANRPRLLLADEPTGNLDSATGAAIIELLDEVHADGTTVAVVTHDETLANKMPRIVRVKDGQVGVHTGYRSKGRRY